MLLKALLGGALYGLSKREEALDDRLSFRRFVGLRWEQSVPDHGVLNRFRNELVRLELYELLFAELDKQLMEKGAILKRGTMLDATVIKAISRPPRGGQSQPTPMRASPKGRASLPHRTATRPMSGRRIDLEIAGPTQIKRRDA